MPGGSADTGSPGRVTTGGARPAPAVVGVIWALLVVNTLGSSGQGTIVEIPTRAAQLITMGALLAAFLLALVINPRCRFRPSVFLFLLSMLLVVSLAASLRMESGFGALARCARLAAFLATLWLLTPWWSAGIALVRHHVRALVIVLLTVLIGLLIAPGQALPDSYGDRLVGALWYLPPPQVAQFAAVVVGLAMLLWLSRMVSGPNVAWVVIPSTGLLLLTHTRTALAALVVGLIIAGATLVSKHARVRKAIAIAVPLGALLAAVFGPAVLDWLQRGQSEDVLQSLTGRQKVWDQLLAMDRSPIERLLGMGLTDKSFNGHPIDSTWLAVYHEQGILGVAIVVGVFVCLIGTAARRPPSAERACAIFLIVYCIVASYTEVGTGDASLYMLHLALASALLVRRRTPEAEIPTSSRRYASWTPTGYGS